MFQLLSIFLFSLGFTSYQPDSNKVIDSSLVYQIQIDPLTQLYEDTIRIDHIKHTVHRFDPASLHFHWHANLGNAGTHAIPLSYSFDSLVPLRSGIHTLETYSRANSFTSNFIRRKPYTQIYYVMGVAKEQMLDLTHYQPAGKHFDASLHYRVHNAPGSFQNQRANLATFGLQARYKTLNQRYEASMSFKHYKFKIEENGGIANDSLYLANNESDRRVIPVNLQNAHSLNRLTAWSLRQNLRLFKPTTAVSKFLIPRNAVLTSSIDNYYRTYSDPDPNSHYYTHIYRDSLFTYDSIHIQHQKHTLAVTNRFAKDQAILYEAGFSYHIAQYFDGNASHDHQLIQPIVKLRLRLSDDLQMNLTHTSLQGSSYKGDMSNAIRINFTPVVHWTFTGGLMQVVQHPSLLGSSFYGNHIQWDQGYGPQKSKRITASAAYKGWQLQSSYTQQTGTFYVDAFGYPRQYIQEINILETELNSTFSIGPITGCLRAKHHSSDRSSILRYPSVITSAMVYFHQILFDSALRLQAGIDLSYLSEWYGLNYVPEAGQFVLQQKKQTGDKLFGDVFVNLHLSRASVFLKYRGLTSLLFGERFSLVPDYPQMRPGIFFGVNWRFFD